MFGLLVTGEFMKLTGVTRNTLIHYDNLGLLKPVRTNTRGDRYYHPFQWYTIILIKAFQTAGIDLRSIKSYLDKSFEEETGENYIMRFAEVLRIEDKLSATYKELIRNYRYIDKMVYLTNFFDEFNTEDGPVIVKAKNKGSLKINYLDRDLSMSSAEYYSMCNKVIFEQYSNLRDGSFPLITHFRKENFIKGENSVFAISNFTLGVGNKYLPECDYYDCIAVRRVGDISSVFEACDEIRDYMNENMLEPVADINVMTNIFSFNSKGVRFGDRLIIVPVKKAEEDKFVKLKKIDWRTEDSSSDIWDVTSHLLSSGEFIKMCNITRNALNHYEKLKIIRPEYVAENGYKYYGISQIYTLINIKCLKQAGFSLEQIKTIWPGTIWDDKYLERRLNILTTQKALIYDKIKDVVDAKIYLKELTEGFQGLSKEHTGKGHMAFLRKKRYLRRIAFSPDTYKDQKGFGKEVMAAIKTGKEREELYEFPIGISINSECESESLASVNMVNPKYKNADDLEMSGKNLVYLMSCCSRGYIEQIKEITEDAKAQGLKIRGSIINLFMLVQQKGDREVEMQSVILVPVE
ncbi:MAG: MerR family transcriptional regulator [Lachnospiraceae bacterium]